MTDLNHADDKKAKPTLVGFVCNLIVQVTKYLIERGIKKKEAANLKLQNWRNNYVAKRNARVIAADCLGMCKDGSQKKR